MVDRKEWVFIESKVRFGFFLMFEEEELWLFFSSLKNIFSQNLERSLIEPIPSRGDREG
jgi:hypothetical protein